MYQVSYVLSTSATWRSTVRPAEGPALRLDPGAVGARGLRETAGKNGGCRVGRWGAGAPAGETEKAGRARCSCRQAAKSIPITELTLFFPSRVTIGRLYCLLR